MDVSSLTNEDKFFKILHLLLNFNVKLDDIYLQKLIEQLSKEDNSCFLIKVDIIINWIQTVQTDYENGNKFDINTFCLAIDLTKIFCKSEADVSKIKERHIFEKFALLIKQNNELQVIAVKLSFIKLIRRLSELENGLEWIIQLKIWQFFSNIKDNLNHSQITLREQASLLVDLLIQIEEQKNYKLCQQIIESLIIPLVDKAWFDIAQNVVRVNDLNFVTMILTFHRFMEHFFLHIIKRQKKLVSSYILLIKCGYQNKGWESRDVSIEQTYVQQLLRTEIAADFVRLVFMQIPPDDKIAKPLSFEKFTINFFNYIYFCTERFDPHNVLIVSEYVGRLWAKLGDIKMQPNEAISHSNLKFGDQILMIQLMPILHVIKERTKEETEYLDKFCLKLFYISCEYTTRHLYAIQEVLRLSGKCVLDLACKSIKSIVQSEGLLTNDRAILVFQALIYCLSEFLPLSSASVVTVVLEKSHLLSCLLVGLHSLVKNYQISWKECIESSTLVNISLALLANPLLSSRLAVQVLNLLQISIEHFLAINMALLVDHLDGSGLENLGPSIKSRLSDDSWEVRDSTIQLVISIICISKAKYPTFQDMLVKNNILPVVLKMATQDSEEYVRANAFKCVKYMVEIKNFWGQINATKGLLKELVNVIFHQEEEALVKREAVKALTSLYTHVGIKSETAGLCFSTMAYICINDLDWEVKINALEFWKIVLEQTFHAQGWTNDRFPPTIFTGQQKKIVHVTENEIYCRLSTITRAFEYYGGFGVILSCVNDSSDLIVSEKALKIIEMLRSRLNKYGYIEKRLAEQQYQNIYDVTLDEATIQVSRKTSIASQEIKKSDGESEDIEMLVVPNKPEKVIEDIVAESDFDLLSSTLDNMQLNCDILNDRIDENLYTKFSRVSELMFFNIITKVDLKDLNYKRRKWLESDASLSVLLEDVIFSFAPNELNRIDCC